MKLCVACGVEFNKRRKDQNSCGNICKRKVWKILNRDKVNAWQRQYFHGKVLLRIKLRECGYCKIVFTPQIMNHPYQKYCSVRCRNSNFRHTERGRELHNFCSRNRRHKIKANGGNLTKQEWSEILELYENKCGKCGDENRITMDHIMPIALGGEHTKGNIQPLCVSCNSKKHIKIEFYPARNTGHIVNFVNSYSS